PVAALPLREFTRRLDVGDGIDEGRLQQRNLAHWDDDSCDRRGLGWRLMDCNVNLEDVNSISSRNTAVYVPSLNSSCVILLYCRVQRWICVLEHSAFSALGRFTRWSITAASIAST